MKRYMPHVHQGAACMAEHGLGLYVAHTDALRESQSLRDRNTELLRRSRLHDQRIAELEKKLATAEAALKLCDALRNQERKERQTGVTHGLSADGVVEPQAVRHVPLEDDPT
jgi:hypothetical protein